MQSLAIGAEPQLNEDNPEQDLQLPTADFSSLIVDDYGLGLLGLPDQAEAQTYIGLGIGSGLNYIDARWYGVDTTGANDSTTDFNNARAAARAANAPLYVPGIVLITSTLAITTSETWIGTAGSKIIWGGASGGTMVTITVTDMLGGGISNITLDANHIAASGLISNGSSNGEYNFLSIINFTTGDGLKIVGGGTTDSWNHWRHLYTDGDSSYNQNGHSCIWLTSAGGGNACHNIFYGPIIYHGGNRPGWLLGNCDNNTIYNPWTQRQPGGTNAGFLCDPTEFSGRPSGNVCFHVQAGAGGWVQPGTTATSPAFIYGYNQDNGQPNPVTNGTPLLWINDNGDYHGGHIYGNNADFVGPAPLLNSGPPSANTGAAQFAALGFGPYEGTFFTHYSSAYPGNVADLVGFTVPFSYLSELTIRNASGWLVTSNTNVPFMFAPNGKLMLQLSDGVQKMPNMPTSDPHVVNQLWNSSGTVKISSG
jgi:hypothetical protein